MKVIDTAVSNYKTSFKDHKKDFDQAYLKLSKDVDKFNRQWGFLQSKSRAKELVQQVKELVDYADTFNDPSDIEKQNQAWLKETLSLIEEEGGAFAGDLKSLAIDGYMVASAQGLRIAEDKVRKEASLKLDTFDAQFNQALADGDLSTGLDIQQEREAMLNSLVVEGIYNKNEASAFLKNSRQQYADSILLKSLEQNQLLEVTQNKAAALEDMKNNKTMFNSFFNRASDKVQTAFLKRMKLLTTDASTNNLIYSQFEYADTLNSWMLGAATSADVMKETKEYISAIKTAKPLVKKDRLPKLNREIEKAKITVDLVEDIGRAGYYLANGRKTGSPIMDLSLSVDEVAEAYGYAPNTPGASIIAEIRNKLTFVKNDAVLNRVLMYEFATGSAGLDKDLPDIDTIDNLSDRIIREKAVDGLMGGRGNMSSVSADAVREYLKDPAANEVMNEVISDNPELIYEVAKHRNKTENAATTTRVTDFMQTYFSILNVSSTDLATIHAKLAEDQHAQIAHNRIFNFIEEIYGKNKAITAFAEQENIGKQQLFLAITSAVYNRMNQGLAQTGDSDRLLSARVSRDITETEVGELAKHFIGALSNQQQTRGLVNVTDSPALQQSTDNSSLVVSMFSHGSFGLFNKIWNVLPDVGTRNVKEVTEVEYNKLKVYIEGLLGNNKVDLDKGRLRLMTHSGSIYKLGYINGFGALVPLINADNDMIYLNTELIDKPTTKETDSAKIIDWIIKSNVQE